MPFALVTIGLLMIVVGAKNTHREFGAELVSEFTGEGNFMWWLASIGAIGALGYVESLRSFSRYFMALVIIAMLLSNEGFFAKLTQALKTGPVAPARHEGESAQGGDSLASHVSVDRLNSDFSAAYQTGAVEGTRRIQSAGSTALSFAKLFV